MKRSNRIAKLLTYCAFGIMGLGVIAFFVIILDHRFGTGVQGISVLTRSLVMGVLFLGFAEAVHLLQGIHDQGTDHEAEEYNFTYEKEVDDISKVDPEDEREIHAFFKERDQKVGEIHPTDEPFIYIVDVDGRKRKVEAGGFTLKILE
ncbi:hypothetical protein [Halobacillus aidingensis]|uniref:Uncharacterized protein n=1 Tax=Halobacillus aidingensis TaxID=240303 RepID=A0A1H0FQU8_HALAD|nr:hypothetical protein [Halobacillus aidingensis]SDN96849.1 hypothetical protein SAMN05421677_10279 [Halobacillus aidingensis]